MISLYAEIEFGKPIVVTELSRTPAENTALYAATIAAGGKEPDWRPHTQWLAFDLRSSTFTDREIQKMLSVLNSITSFGGQRKTAVYHAIAGNTFHFHVQSNK